MGCCGKTIKAIKNAPNIVKGFTALAIGLKYEFTDDRIRACQQCDQNCWLARSLWCKKCDCFVPAKARVKEETCPLDRWPDRKGVRKNGKL
tara:strand:- start:68 stop:340 length:273 start_codon:yes stop_codon:yes gene_type:complete